MCFEITIFSESLATDDLKLVADKCNESSELEVTYNPPHGWFKKTPPSISISEEGGCACSMLSDDADWNTGIWELREDQLIPLSDTMSRLRANLPKGFIFKALWGGDRIDRNEAVSLEEISKIILSNKLQQNTSYEINRNKSV